jgi:hypothetical protein
MRLVYSFTIHIQGELPKGISEADYVFFGTIGIVDQVHQPTLSHPVNIAIPVSNGALTQFNIRETVARALPKYEWQNAEFKEAFYELDQSTTGLQNVPLDVEKQMLHVLQKNSGPAFEAFGQKFPVEATTRWGIILVLGIQCYFWLHLAEYRRRKFPHSDIAWIGTYPHFWPRLLFFATACVMPFGILTFLLFYRREPPFPSRLNADLCLALTFTLALLCWREYNRRQTTTPGQSNVTTATP